MKKLILSLTFFIVFSSTFAYAKTYYVAKNGDDSNSGTESKPWLTVSKAASMAVAGNTVLVKDGTYDEKVRFSNDGTENAYITFKVYSNHQVTINYSGTDDHVVLFKKAYIIFEGFKIISAKFQPIRLNPGAHHVIVKNCELAASGGTFHGLLIESDAVHHCTFEKNIIHGHGIGKLHHGMYIKGDYHIIDGNIVYYNGQHGIHMYNEKGSVKHCIVRNNICYGNGVRSKNASGIIVTQGDNLIHNNICYGNGGVSNSNSFGIFIYNVPPGDGPNKIYNNVLYNNGRAGLGIQGSDNTIVKNNICMNNVQHNIFVLNSRNTFLDYNCYYPDGDTQFLWGERGERRTGGERRQEKTGGERRRGEVGGERGGGISYNFTKYKTASGQDAHSICQNPKFVDVNSNNFNLRSDSPCLSAGTDVGLPYRGKAPNIGLEDR